MRPRQGGFTLLEVLVGVAVLGLIIGVLYGGVSFALQAAQRQDAVLAKTGDYDAVNRALRRLIAEADAGGPGIVPLRGSPGRMTFSSRMPDAAGGGAADMAVGITGGTVVLRWTPHRPGRPLGPAPAAREVELLLGAQRVELSYWGASGWHGEWAEAILPALVRLRVVFAPDDARHWPDMVLATRQQTAS